MSIFVVFSSNDSLLFCALCYSGLLSSSGATGVPIQSLLVPSAGGGGTSMDHLLLLNNLLGKSAEASALGFLMLVDEGRET